MEPLEICYLSAAQLSGLIRRKEISPVEVVTAHLDRIQATDGLFQCPNTEYSAATFSGSSAMASL